MISNGSIKGRNICAIGFTILVRKRHISKIHSLNLKSKLISVTLTQDMYHHQYQHLGQEHCNLHQAPLGQAMMAQYSLQPTSLVWKTLSTQQQEETQVESFSLRMFLILQKKTDFTC